MELFIKLRFLILFGLLLSFPSLLLSQNFGLAIEEVLEEIAESSEEDLPEDWFEYMYSLTDNPLNLNTATVEDLQRIRFLSYYQIENLHHYIFQYGQIYSIYELLGVDGFDRNTVKWLSHFVTVLPAEQLVYEKFSNKDTVFVKGESLIRTSRVVEPLKGALEHKFNGSPWQVLLKQKVEAGNYRVGLVYEKDVGESFWNTTDKRPEYLSLSMEYRGEKALKHVIAGNFRANFGQGLTLWQNFGFGKSSLVMNGVKNGPEFVSHSSASEYNYFQGAAATFYLKQIEVSLFGSFRKPDATLNLNSDQPVVTSITETGYHRTESEMARRSNLNQSAFGARIEKSINRLKIGTNYHAVYYKLPVRLDGFSETLAQYQALSIDGIYTGSKFVSWAEAALDLRGHFAMLGGVNLYPSGVFSLALIGRSFHKDYRVVYSSAFSENGEANNENGIYIGAEFFPVKGLKVQSYIDLFRFMGPKFNVATPSSGFEILSNFLYAAQNHTDLSLKFKFEQKEKNKNEGRFKTVQPYDKLSLKFNIKSDVTNVLKLQSRLDYNYSTYSGLPEHGWMVLQDFKFRLPKPKLGLDARIAFFSTDSYFTGVYAYEPDVLYAFAVPVYYGYGIRFLLNLKYQPVEKLTIYLKTGQFRYNDRTSISSGWTQINSNLKTDIRLQVRLKF